MAQPPALCRCARHITILATHRGPQKDKEEALATRSLRDQRDPWRGSKQYPAIEQENTVTQ
jgi:hypothetical protein